MNEELLDWNFGDQVVFFKKGWYDLIRLPDPKTGKIIKFTPKQIEAIELFMSGEIKNLGYGGAARGGKTFFFCALFILLCFAFPDTRYCIGRKSLTNLKQTTITTFVRLCKKCGIKEVDKSKLEGIDGYAYNENSMDHVIKFNNKSEVIFIKTKLDPEDIKDDLSRFGSLELTSAAIDEANETALLVIETIGTRVGNWNNHRYGLPSVVIEVFNPSKGHVKDRYWTPFKNKQETKTKRFIRALPTDNPSKEVKKYVADQTEKYLNGELSKTQYNRLIKGNFDYDSSPNALCRPEAIAAIFNNHHCGMDGETYLTADIARMGSDKAKIAVWKGYTIVERLTFDKSRTTEIESAIFALQTKYGIPYYRCIADEDGVGGGVIDHTGINGFINGSRALNEENYYNLKSQCGYKMAQIINQDKFWVACDLPGDEQQEITDELECLQSYQVDKDGKLRTLPKAKIKEIIARSPDWLDTIIMRAWFDLKQGEGFGLYSSFAV